MGGGGVSLTKSYERPNSEPFLPFPMTILSKKRGKNEIKNEMYIFQYAERHPVHFATNVATDIAILKPVIREHAPQLIIKDEDGDAPLDRAKTKG